MIAPDQRVAEARRHADLVGELAREGEPEEPRLHAAADRDRAGGEIGEGLVGKVVSGSTSAAQHIARARPGDRRIAPIAR